MIVTITLNAALDRTLVARGFTVGRSYTVERGLSLGGGKGMNVARALRCLHVPVLALGFAGGLVGEMMRQSLTAEGLPHELTQIRGESRICTAIADPASGVATEVNEPGPGVGEDEAAAFLESFDRACSRAQMIVLSGSLPEGLPSDFYAMLIERARATGVQCVLDTRGAALQAGVQARPLVVKPNEDEAAELLGSAFDPNDRAALRRGTGQDGPGLMAITLGRDGAVLQGQAGAWRAWPPRVQAVDTVGAGDSFLAGMVAVLVRAAGDGHMDEAIERPEVLEEMLRLATATAAANTLTLGAGRCDPRDIARLLPDVRVEQIA